MNRPKRNYFTFLSALILSSTLLNAQNKNDISTISTKPFGDSERHWYGIKDESNLINPVPNQPKYPESDYIKIADNMILFQRDNGGWPQYYPLEKNYSRHITFNDGAYMGIIDLLDKIVNGDSNFAFIDVMMKSKVTVAYNKGIDCILNTQIKDNGRLTAWCQQHDEVSLDPAWARKFEPPSICNAESVEIVLFLMKQKKPSKRIIQSIQSATKWFADSKIYNTKIESFEIEALESKYKTIKRDIRVVVDSTAAPIWTRYYELGTYRPLFCDRNSEFLYSLAEVSLERRSGYAWYTYAPQKVLDKYGDWQKKWTPNSNVLKI